MVLSLGVIFLRLGVMMFTALFFAAVADGYELVNPKRKVMM